MREMLARWLTAIVGLMIVSASLGFAVLQNHIRPARISDSPIEAPQLEFKMPDDPEAIAKGAQVYDDQACSLCHSIAGVGDPRYPLDGIGARRDAGDIRKFIAPPEEMRSLFPGRSFDMKQPYRDLPEDEMNALVDYLRSIR